MILHADIDAFFASVEQVKNPRLRGRPVVVGGKPGEASVIASCSYEARRFGLSAGMPLREAARLCPQAVFLTGSYPEYRRASDAVFALLADLSPQVEVVSLDEAYVDLSGAEQIHGGAWRAARSLRRRALAATGLHVTVGIGPTRILARLMTACAKPDGIGFVEPAQAQAFLATLPLSALPGIGRKTLDLLGRLNLDRVGDLARLPEDLLVETLGARGRTLSLLARGQDPRPVDSDRRKRSVSRRSALAEPSADTDLLLGYLFYLCERTALGLREIRARARSVRVSFEYADYKAREGQATLADPSDLETELFAAARPLFLKMLDRRVLVRRVGIDAHNLVFGAPRQALLFDLAHGPAVPPGAAPFPPPLPSRAERAARLARAVAGIRRRHGFHRIVQGPSVALMGQLPQNEHGFVLRTASLTR